MITQSRTYFPHYGHHQDVTYAFDAATNNTVHSQNIDDGFPMWTFCFKTLINPQNIFVQSHHEVTAGVDYQTERDPDKFRYVLNSVIRPIHATTAFAPSNDLAGTQISQIIDFVPFLLTGSVLAKVDAVAGNKGAAVPGYFKVTQTKYLYRFIATACTAPSISETSDAMVFSNFDHPDDGTDLIPVLISGQVGNNTTQYEIYATHTANSLTAPTTGVMTANSVDYTITEFAHIPVELPLSDPFVSKLPMITSTDVRNGGTFNQFSSSISMGSAVQDEGRIASIAITQAGYHTATTKTTNNLRIQAWDTFNLSGHSVVL